MASPLSLSPYDAARLSAVFYRVPVGGSLRLTGEHRRDFLQRQTSNDLGLLDSGRAVLTVLTSPAGRILDVLYLVQEPEAIFALTLPGIAVETTQFLQSRIFFMDRVAVDDLSQAYVQVDLIGPGAGRILADLGLNDELVPNHILTLSIGAGLTRVLGLERSFGFGYRLISPLDDWAAIEANLLKGGVTALGEDTYQILRVEAGVPAVGHELTGDYTPLETGLAEAVSDSKGCYTGQEVLARQISYDKVTQSLCGMQLDGPVENGTRLWEDGKAVGKLTSTANSPRFGWIGLAVVKRPYNRSGVTVRVGEKDGVGCQANIVKLPFGSD
jgi:folate-binding protein YgfZ